jgi:hypothetical protein
MAYYQPYSTGFSPFPDAGYGVFAGIPTIAQPWVPQPAIFASQSIFSSSVEEPEYENIFAPSGTLDEQIAELKKKKRFVWTVTFRKWNLDDLFLVTTSKLDEEFKPIRKEMEEANATLQKVKAAKTDIEAIKKQAEKVEPELKNITTELDKLFENKNVSESKGKSADAVKAEIEKLNKEKEDIEAKIKAKVHAQCF